VKGWIDARWETSEHNRPARVYRLTPAGRKQLVEERARWNQMVAAVAAVMGAE
jgi:PadR family transcriptional regulator